MEDLPYSHGSVSHKEVDMSEGCQCLKWQQDNAIGVKYPKQTDLRDNVWIL